MALWSLDRRFCVFSPSLRELLGYSEQEISQSPDLFIDRIHPEDRGDFMSAWQRLCVGHNNASCRYRFTPKHGIEVRTIWENSLLLPTQGSEPQGALTLYAEERKRFEKIGEAQELRNVLHGVAHEVGNHLQAINGELELLKWSGSLPEDSAGIVSSAITQIRSLTGDIEEYFFPLSAEHDNSDLASVLEKAMRDSEEKIKANGIRSELIFQGTVPSVSLDSRYGKTLKAIIDFSCALLSGGGELKIQAATCRRDGRHYIELDFLICCHGNLPVEENRVFRAFINVGGYRPGLSMTVARRFLRRQSGKIVFRKEGSNGGVFSIIIPVAESAG